MGTSKTTDRPSLDRLKALDSLPDLDAQLTEARSLCNHNARAEMIGRWLMAKLKSSPEACQSGRSWSTLSWTLRLISPSRIALLVNQLPGILQTTCSTEGLSKETVLAIAELLNLLFELGQAIDGAAIKSLLSMESSAAASFCGSWFRHVKVRVQEQEREIVESKSLLSPALQIWELRKRHDSDDSNFHNHCLVPALPLLGLLERTGEPASKRKRGENAAGPLRANVRALESLIAKHTILPARTAYFRKADPQARRIQRGPTQISIEEALDSLKKALQDDPSLDLFESAPRVLDVALRSVSTPTPRHRLKERPWIESIFAGLRDCFDGQTVAVQNHALIRLLRSIRINRSTLPLATLAGLVKDNVTGASSSGTAVDWELVASVVELDSNFLANSSSTNEVFDQITKEQSDEDKATSNSRMSKWTDQIVLPTMRAYAQSRTLAVFTDCWCKQLLTVKTAYSWTVWDEIGGSFADILESSLPADTILELVERFSLTVLEIIESNPKLTDLEIGPKLRATLCVLVFLLKGIRSDALISIMHPRLESLLATLLGLSELKGFKTTIAGDCHYLHILIRVFELWYPRWASIQNDQEIITSKGASLLSNKAFKVALTQCSDNNTRKAQGAQAYIATLCHCFTQYGGNDGCAELCAKALKHIAEHNAGAALVFIQFPDLLAMLQSGLRKELLKSILQAQDSGSDETQINAVLCSFQGVHKTPILEEFVSVAIEQLKTLGTNEKVILSTLASIDAAALDQTQRINILDTLLELPATREDDAGVAQLQRRLALILKLVSLPCQDSRLSTEASALWDLVSLLEKDVSPETEDADRPDSLDNVHMLEEITRLVMRPWLATQDREKSRELLVQMSKRIKDRVKSEKKTGKLAAGRAALGLIKVIIAMIESNAHDATKQAMVHRESKTARAYVELLTGAVARFTGNVQSEPDKASESETSNCVFVLEALVDLPDAFLAAAGLDASEHLERPLTKLEHAKAPRVNSKYRSALATLRFRLQAKHALKQDLLVHSAMEIMRSDHPSAREQAEVLSAYESNFKASGSDFKLRVTFDVLTKRPETQSVESLLLLRAAIRGLTKEDFEGSSIVPPTLLHRNLQAANQGDDLLARRTALQNLTIIFKEKPFMTNQYGIEQTISTLQSLLKSYPYPGALYLDITQVLTSLFLHHRSRLQGRFHLVIALLQTLLTQLFRANKASPPTPPELAVRQARALARLLESFSNPPPLRHRGKSSELVDEARKAQAHAGQFAQYLLHHYCAQVLTGILGEGVREALLPGLWAVIEAMEVYNSDAIKALSAAVNGSERAVLRSVYEDWKRFGKWEGL